MRAFGVWLLCLAVMGCQEYEIKSTQEPAGLPNPKDLPSQENTDRILQVTVPSVDVLFVVDNSSSMMDEQQQLTAAFPKFLEFFLGSGLDYHVGVVSTDMDDPQHRGKLRESRGLLWIDDQTQEPVSVFREMASLGISGSGDESGREASYSALELLKDGFNAGFSRADGAGLHVVIISDERDWSDNSIISADEFVEYLLHAARPNGVEVTFNSIVNPPGCCSPLMPESPGVQYIDVTQRVGGILWEIHNPDWEQVLEQLGMQAAGLRREFFLSQLPVPGTIVVEITDPDGTVYELVEGTDWAYDPTRNSITLLEFVPDPLSQIHIKYKVLSADG